MVLKKWDLLCVILRNETRVVSPTPHEYTRPSTAWLLILTKSPMRAVVITRYGGPEVLDVREIEPPPPGPREVLIRVRASALNRADILQRMGRYPAPPDVAKDVSGIEFAGEVAAIGAGCSLWSSGDRVMGLVSGGAHADFVVVNEATLLRIPAGWTWAEAAAAPEAFITAYDALVTQAGLRSGETVLIHAVGSGVGLAATQLVRSWGGIPYGTSRTGQKIVAAVSRGLVDGVAVTSDIAAVVTSARRWTSGRGVDIVLDLVGGHYVAVSIDALARMGRLLLVGTIGGPRATIELGRVLAKRLTIRGTVLRSRSLEEKVLVTRAFEGDVMPRFANGDLKPDIDSVYPISAIADAHRRMESNASCGKVVLLMD